MSWRDDWPVIGEDPDGDGKGQPVMRGSKPRALAGSAPVTPQTSDDFDADTPGLQWQWQANSRPEWWSLTARPGSLRLAAVAVPEGRANLWEMPSLLLQKLPAPAFVATTQIDASGLRTGERAGLVVMGLDYAYLAVRRSERGLTLAQAACAHADEGTRETDLASVPVRAGSLLLRVAVREGAACRFSFSRDGRAFEPIGPAFVARPGLWVGAKVGLFAQGPAVGGAPGHADFAWFRVE